MLTEIEVDFGNFGAYDVEPHSIPDVLAERPVLVFGKWRGEPRGLIELKGTSGRQSYRETIDVSAIEPLSDHSALRYLWARHRITLLSDYNKLRALDERVREVMDLGLTYNLLTAYTSFVAIDTQARLKGDEAQTVKQPLPLPQGVSSLAVGRGGALQKMALAPASPMVSRPPKGGLADNCLKVEEEPEPARPEEPCLEVGKITVTGGLSEQRVRMILTQSMPALNACLDPAANRGENDRVVFTLIVGQDGRVGRVIIGKTGFLDKGMEKCMIRHLEALRFPMPEEGKTVKISVAFDLK